MSEIVDDLFIEDNNGSVTLLEVDDRAMNLYKVIGEQYSLEGCGGCGNGIEQA